MIFGVTGTNGAGKGTVVEYLAHEKSFLHLSVRGFLFEEIQRRGLPEDRNSLREVANDLRQKHGPAFVVESLFKQAQEQNKNVVLESVRTVGEAEFLRNSGAYLIAVDAGKELRYERAVLRGSMTDKVSFEEFTIQEDREMVSTEPWDMNVFKVMEMSDFVLTNDGSREELYAQIEDMLSKAKAREAHAD